MIIADNATVGIDETNVVTAKGVDDEQNPVEDSDDANVIVPCQGNVIQGLVWYDAANGTLDVLDPGEELVTLSTGAKVNALIYLIPNNGADATNALAQVTNNGAFKFENVAAGTYAVDVVDEALAQSGYVPSATSIKFNFQPKACVPTEVGFGYSPQVGYLGDYVWYDVNSNGKQDEWLDANNDGAITQNTGTFAFKAYEFVDLNGNGTPDLDLAGEVYKCGLLVADTKLLTLLDAANAVADTDRTNVDGYYRFRELALAPWTVTIDARNASLIAAGRGDLRCRAV